LDIITRIEHLRRQLTNLGEKKGLQDPEVIKLSRKLDELIVLYYRAQAKHKVP
jgi:hypothetical protein